MAEKTSKIGPRASGRFRRALIRLEGSMISLLLGGMLSLVLFQVFLRYFFNSGISWSEELSRYFFIWIILIGSALGVEEGKHFSVDFFVERYLSSPLQKIVRFAGNVLVAVFISVFLYSSISLCIHVWEESSPSLDVSMAVIFLCMPLSAFLMIVHLASKKGSAFFGGKEG